MINPENVISSYTGKQGCMCGCIGNHRFASAHVEEARKQRGYDIGLDEISDRSVKMAVNRLNKLIDWSDLDMVKKYVNEDHAYFDTDNGRTIHVYFSENKTMKWTKGTWEAFSSRAGVGVTADHPLSSSDVAHCDGFNGRRTRQEEEANAHLMSASKELYEALELCLEIEERPTVRAVAEAAMAKARGEQK